MNSKLFGQQMASCTKYGSGGLAVAGLLSALLAGCAMGTDVASTEGALIDGDILLVSDDFYVADDTFASTTREHLEVVARERLDLCERDERFCEVAECSVPSVATAARALPTPSAERSSGSEPGAFYLGRLVHTLEDSYASGHAANVCSQGTPGAAGSLECVQHTSAIYARAAGRCTRTTLFVCGEDGDCRSDAADPCMGECRCDLHGWNECVCVESTRLHPRLLCRAQRSPAPTPVH